MAWALSVKGKGGRNGIAEIVLIHVRRRWGNPMKPIHLLESVLGAASAACMTSNDTTNEALARAMRSNRVLWIIGRGRHVQADNAIAWQVKTGH